MMYNRFRGAVFATTVVLTCTMAAACGSGSSSGGTGGGTVGGAVGGVAGGNAGGAAAAGGAAGVIEVPTEVIPCRVEFSPANPAANGQALGMTWGAGIITFAVSVSCPKPLSRGSLEYAIFHTGPDSSGLLADNKIGSPSFPMAGVESKTFPVVFKCDPGMWLFEYQWNGTIDGASDDKQDANSGTGVLLTSFNCK